MIKVLLVDDYIIIRKAIKNILNNQPKIQVIGECSNGNEVIPFIETQMPDIILMDYQMPILNGLETTKLVRKYFPEIKIIGFSSAEDNSIKTAFLQNGACGFLSKYDANIDNLVREINNCYSIT